MLELVAPRCFLCNMSTSASILGVNVGMPISPPCISIDKLPWLLNIDSTNEETR